MQDRLKCGMIIFILAWLTMATPLMAGPHHKYQSGVVQRINNNEITIETGTYRLIDNVSVIRIEHHGDGIHYEHKGSLSDVRTGVKVHLKATGRKVSVIEVMR